MASRKEFDSHKIECVNITGRRFAPSKPLTSSLKWPRGVSHRAAAVFAGKTRGVVSTVPFFHLAS